MKKVEGGVELEDIVDYKIPFAPGFIGTIVNNIICKPKLKGLFSHRKLVIDEMFPTK